MRCRIVFDVIVRPDASAEDEMFLDENRTIDGKPILDDEDRLKVRIKLRTIQRTERITRSVSNQASKCEAPIMERMM